MVTLPPETSMFSARMAPARVRQRGSTAYTYARIRSSCPRPKPETLNPKTESGTSGAGPGPGPLYTPPATHECETEQTCEMCEQTPPQMCEWPRANI